MASTPDSASPGCRRQPDTVPPPTGPGRCPLARSTHPLASGLWEQILLRRRRCRSRPSNAGRRYNRTLRSPPVALHDNNFLGSQSAPLSLIDNTNTWGMFAIGVIGLRIGLFARQQWLWMGLPGRRHSINPGSRGVSWSGWDGAASSAPSPLSAVCAPV